MGNRLKNKIILYQGILGKQSGSFAFLTLTKNNVLKMKPLIIKKKSK